MDNAEKISGTKMYALLEKLKTDHTILNIHVMGTKFDGLTILLGLSDEENKGFFIDYPGSAGVVAPVAEGKKCYFQFSDGEKIQYSFRATILKVIGRRIKFYLPEYIERTQRRDSFRVPVPPGVRFSCKDGDGNKMVFAVVNISEGGILVETGINHLNRGAIFNGKKISGITLFYDQEETPVNIRIDSVEIVRITKQVETMTTDIGFKILEIKRDDRNELKSFIYYCQRRVLKERGGFDE